MKKTASIFALSIILSAAVVYADTADVIGQPDMDVSIHEISDVVSDDLVSGFEDIDSVYGTETSGFFDASCLNEESLSVFDSPSEGLCVDFSIGEDAVVTEGDKEYTIDIVVNDRVEKFIKYFQGRGRKHFVLWLERSEKYMPLVTGILKEMELPEDLAYLALIESGFNPNARSHKNAVGMWQFMPYTAKKYGLRVDWWIDERKDPVKATVAASKYLKTLYGMFDSWFLAGAAYNAGEGKILRAIKKHKTDDFWTLSSYKKPLKRETCEYIPKYIAAMMIAKNPAAYGFTELNYHAPISYDEVTVPYPTDIKVIADAADTTAEEIKALNPELPRWFTPAEYPGYKIKLPRGKGEIFESRFSLIPPGERLKFHTHKVKKGETLSQIARRYGTDIKPIMYLNDMKSPRSIREGALIVVPVRAKAAPLARVTEFISVSSTVYVVKAGDTIFAISRTFGVTADELLKWNNIHSADRLMVGQKLFIKEALLEEDSRDRAN